MIKRWSGPGGPVLAAVLLAFYYAFWSLRLHWSYHSNGWDLGIIDQVVWNTSRGHWFEYTFRNISYAGDHWQPVLLLFVPLKWMFSGPEALLVAQAALLGAAVVPLYHATKRLTGNERLAWAVVLAFGLSLGVVRAVSFDVHGEAFTPLLVFAAIWALATGRNGWFVVCGLGLLLVKEDGALVAVSCAWIAALEFGQRRPAAAVVCVAIVYGAIVNVWLIPHFRGSDLNPLAERFGYLGSSVPEILWSILTRPDLVMNQLADREIAAGVFLLMLGVAFLPLAVPKLLPSLVLVTLPALLSQSGAQPRLELHYLLVPATVALVLALMALRWLKQDEDHGSRMRMAGAGLVMAAVLVFAWQSPLPPSTAAEWDRFEIGKHARAADAIVAMVPDGAVVSAQSAFVPHLAERRKIYQFPRVVDAAWVITDKYGPVPADDLAAGYWTCVSALPRLGYDPVREDDGITIWEKRRTADAGADVTVDCSGGR